VDGVFRGKYPCKAGLPAGEHTIQLRQDGASFFSKSIRVEAKEKKKFTIPLFAILTGQTVDSARKLADNEKNLAEKERQISSLEGRVKRLKDELEESNSRSRYKENSTRRLGYSNGTFVLVIMLFIESQFFMLLGFGFLSGGFDSVLLNITALLGTLGYNLGLDILRYGFAFLFLFTFVALVAVLQMRKWGSILSAAVAVLGSIVWLLSLFYAIFEIPARGIDISFIGPLVLLLCCLSIVSLAKKEIKRLAV